MMTGSQRSEPEIAVSQVENEGGEVDLGKDGAASSAKVAEVTSDHSLEKAGDDEEELSSNVEPTKDSGEADRILLGDEDELFNI